MPPGMSGKDLPGCWTHIVSVRWVRRFNHHPVESNEDCPPEYIFDTANSIYKQGELDNRIDSEDDCKADDISNNETDNWIVDWESSQQQDLSATPHVLD
jgi:hypothetical protein